MTSNTADMTSNTVDMTSNTADMTSNQPKRPPSSGENNGADLEPILVELGSRGRYQTTQLLLNISASFLFTILLLDYVFLGYQPDYQCNQVQNVTQLEAYLPDDVTNFTLHDVQYHQCSIDVTVNTSGVSSTHSLPCVAGVNFSVPSHTSFLTEWSLVCEEAGLTQVTQTGFFAGQVVGALLFSVLADRYGRRKVYISSALCVTVTLVMTALAPVYYLFLVGRMILGVFSVGMVHPAYTMFTELLLQEYRGVASAMDSIMVALASVFLAAVAYCLQGLSWRYFSLAFYSVFLYSLFLPWFLDESLRWLLATGNITEVEKILEKACRVNGKDFRKIKALLQKQLSKNNDKDQADSTNKTKEGMNKTEVSGEETNQDVPNEKKVKERVGASNAEMANGVCTEGKATGTNGRDLQDDGTANSHSEGSGKDPLKTHNDHSEVFAAKYTVLDLFRHRVVFVPFLVTIFVWSSSNLYYYAVILGSSKLSGNRFLNFGLLNVQNIPSTLVALFLVRRFNRRPLAFTYGMLAGFFLLLSVGLVAFGGGEGVILTVATVAQYAGMFALTGSYVLLFVYFMEVYPTTMRAVGTGTASMMMTMLNMGAPFLFLWAEETPWAPGVMVGCLCCLASLSIWLLPETRHRKLPDTIEEIQAWKRKEVVVE